MKAAKIELARQDVSRRTPQERVVHHWGLARKHIALLAEDVWRCGAALNEVKAVLSHGDFGRWLQSVEIPDRTELQDAGQQATEKNQLVDHYESEMKVGKGFAKGRDVLEERQAEIRRLNHRVYELEEENGSLLRELKKLKRQLKPRNRAIAG